MSSLALQGKVMRGTALLVRNKGSWMAKKGQFLLAVNQIQSAPIAAVSGCLLVGDGAGWRSLHERGMSLGGVLPQGFQTAVSCQKVSQANQKLLCAAI